MKNCTLLLITFSIIFFGCKKKEAQSPIDKEYYRPIYSVFQTFAQLNEGLNEYSKAGYSNLEALAKAAVDLETDDVNVTKVNVVDSSYVYITMNSGHEVVYALFATDAAGNYLYRGGGSNSGGIFMQLSGECNDIENRKILLFNSQFMTTGSAMAVLNDKKEKLGLKVFELTGSECTFEAISTFQDYGLVVLNTHGLPNGFMLGTELPASVNDYSLSLEAFAEKVNLSDPDKIITDAIMVDLKMNIIASKNYKIDVPIYQQTVFDADQNGLYIPGKQIAKLNLSNTIVFGNMCFSGMSNTAVFSDTDIPILTAFQQANVLAYFGYQQTAGMSMQLNSPFAEKMEERLYRGFFIDGDPTGKVHLKANNEEYFDPASKIISPKSVELFGSLYCRQFFADDYCYQFKCPYNYYTTQIFQSTTGNESDDATEWKIWTLVRVLALDSTNYKLEWTSHNKFMDPDKQDPEIVGRVVNWSLDDFNGNKFVKFNPSPGGDEFQITGFEHVFWVPNSSTVLEDVGEEFKKLVGQARVEFCPRGK